MCTTCNLTSYELRLPRNRVTVTDLRPTPGAPRSRQQRFARLLVRDAFRVLRVPEKVDHLDRLIVFVPSCTLQFGTSIPARAFMCLVIACVCCRPAYAGRVCRNSGLSAAGVNTFRGYRALARFARCVSRWAVSPPPPRSLALGWTPPAGPAVQMVMGPEYVPPRPPAART